MMTLRYMRFGIVFWACALLLEFASLYAFYSTKQRAEHLRYLIAQEGSTVTEAKKWVLPETINSRNISKFSQEIQKIAQNFDEIQITFQESTTQKTWIELTMTFTLKHDDIFWKFFTNVHEQYRGRLHSVNLLLYKENNTSPEMDFNTVEVSSDEKISLKGKYIARWYYF